MASTYYSKRVRQKLEKEAKRRGKRQRPKHKVKKVPF